MILNKSSYERGFAHASVYKTECIDLVDERNKATKGRIFHRPAKEAISAKVCMMKGFVAICIIETIIITL